MLGNRRHESNSQSFYECALSLSYPADRALTIDSKLAFRTKLSIKTVNRFVIILTYHIPLCVITYLLLENNTVQYLFIKTRQAMYV